MGGGVRYFDSCWRNKNSAMAPLTFDCSIHQDGYGVPNYACITSDIKTSTLAKVLLEFNESLYLEAHRLKKILLDNNIDDSAKELENPIRLTIKELNTIIDRRGQPYIIMIDKCRAEYNAIRNSCPLTIIRLCQFHIIQAIDRFDGDVKTMGDGKELKWRRSVNKDMIINNFREVQRATSMEHADVLIESFYDKLYDAFDKNSFPNESALHQTVECFYDYFEKNWFEKSDWFHSLCFMDIGLPAEFDRYKVNTNNVVESAFKTFDTIFLNNTKNKRIDHLASIICKFFFPFYELKIQAGNSKEYVNIELTERVEKGYQIYKDDLISNGYCYLPNQSTIYVQCEPGNRAIPCYLVKSDVNSQNAYIVKKFWIGTAVIVRILFIEDELANIFLQQCFMHVMDQLQRLFYQWSKGRREISLMYLKMRIVFGLLPNIFQDLLIILYILMLRKELII